MNWDLVWAVFVIGVVAQLFYTAGRVRGFGDGVIKMRVEVERVLREEMEKLEEKDESKETP